MAVGANSSELIAWTVIMVSAAGRAGGGSAGSAPVSAASAPMVISQFFNVEFTA